MTNEKVLDILSEIKSQVYLVIIAAVLSFLLGIAFSLAYVKTVVVQNDKYELQRVHEDYSKNGYVYCPYCGEKIQD